VKFCLVTTFYPPYHFGGDAIFVSHLAAELGRRGHDVDVVHDVDAYRLLCPHARPVPAPAPTNVTVHPLSSPFGRLSPFVTHQTGRPWLNPALRRLLETGGYDVIHFHNASLIGAGAFSFGRGVKLYTMHEQWLVCPLHSLWKYGREVCAQRECVRCCLHACRPPQWWRGSAFFARQLRAIDRFLAPSACARDTHTARGFDFPVTVLPNFVPDAASILAQGPSPRPRPYVLFVGRLVGTKGLQTVFPAFKARPDVDLVVAGDGALAESLARETRGFPNIVFIGRVAPEALRSLYRHAVALVVPSLAIEVWGLVAQEAMAQATPVIARDNGGLAEVVAESGGGMLYRTDNELRAAVDRLVADPGLRVELGRRGHAAVRGPWSADAHIVRYLEIVHECVEARARRARA
jgi:glycosyltransferase involved in cell wall biosynthesis